MNRELSILEFNFRKQAKDISKGKIVPQHIGQKTGATLQQEFFSIVNSTQPSDLEDEKFIAKWNKMKKEILSLPDGELVYSSFRSKYQNLNRMLP